MTYIKKVELLAHIGWSLATGLTGLWYIWILWGLWVLYDEFVRDGHWRLFTGEDPEWRDFLWDMCSKLIPCIVLIVYYAIT